MSRSAAPPRLGRGALLAGSMACLLAFGLLNRHEARGQEDDSTSCQDRDFTLDELERFQADMSSLLSESDVVFVGVDQSARVVTVAVQDPDAQADAVRAEADRLGVPQTAICVVQSSGVFPVQVAPPDEDGSPMAIIVAGALLVAAVSVVIYLRRRRPVNAGQHRLAPDEP